jgi:similar to stage IV sporulation protein
MKGEVTVRVRCLMPEKLIDRAAVQGARFDDVRLSEDNVLVIRCDAASARTLLALCRRFGLDAAVTRLGGASALRRFARRRGTLAVGIACAVVLSAFFLTRLWFVDIAFTGERAALGDPVALSRSLGDMGIRPGIPRNIDVTLLSQTLLAQGGNYSYVGARLQGVRLLVEAVPEAPAPALYDVEAARDLVCGREGIVVSAVVRSGALCVKPGDAVRLGQVLIRGEELASKEETRPIAALGEVIVRSWFTGEARLPLTQARTVDTGRRSTGAKLAVLGLEWPISTAESYPSQRSERVYLPIGGLFAPMEIERLTNVEIRHEEAEIPEDILRARAAALALADARTALRREGPSRFESGPSRVEYSKSDGCLVARAVIEIQSDAAVTRETLQGG